VIDAKIAGLPDLLAAFPDFDELDLRSRCRTELANLPSSLLAALNADAASRSDDVQKAVGFWARDNTEMVELHVALQSGDRDRALKEGLARVRTKMARTADVDCRSPAEREKAAVEKVAAYERSWSILESAFTPLVGMTIPMICRGLALPSADVARCLKIGTVCTWSTMRACTISPDFVPLFFAHKQHRARVADGTETTGVILQVRLANPIDPILMWAGAVKGSGSYNTYDWQAEIITPPGFRFRIERTVASSNPQLLVLEATQV
jgi:hypothetical protein